MSMNTEQRAVYTVMQRDRQLQKLAQALRACKTDNGALAERSHGYALRRLQAVNAIVDDALAELAASR